MPPFFMIYRFFYIIFKFIVSRFYRRITVIGTPVKNEAVIFVSNHPNMGVDPILIATTSGRELHFFAKSTLFSNLLKRVIFRNLNMVPAYRKSDHQDTGKNQESFKEAIEILKSEGAFLVFPEGTSSEGRTVLPIKSGTARIAIQSGLPLKIQPVSITYLEPREFRSYVTIKYHEPIIQEYSDVKALTEVIESRLKKSDIELDDKNDEIILQKVSKIFVSEDNFDDHSMLVRISQNLKNNEKRYKLLPLIDEFLDKCDQAGVSPELIKMRSKFSSLIYGTLGIIGAIFNFIPKKLTAFFVHFRVNSGIEYAQYRMILGAISYSLWYLSAGYIFWNFEKTFLIILIIASMYLESGRVYMAHLREIFDGSLTNLAGEKIKLQDKLLS